MSLLIGQLILVCPYLSHAYVSKGQTIDWYTWGAMHGEAPVCEQMSEFYMSECWEKRPTTLHPVLQDYTKFCMYVQN